MPKPKTVSKPLSRAERVVRETNFLDLLHVQIDMTRSAPIKDRKKYIGRIVETALKLAADRMYQQKADDLAEALEECSYVVTAEPEIMLDGNMIYIHGHFDLPQLRKRIVW